jgi:hypothetical protein
VGKVVGWVLLLVAGVVSLPVSASFLDGQGTENWVLPVQLVAMAGIGALAGVALPGLASGPTRRRALLGAAYGVAAGLVGVVVFFVLLSGLGGA